MSIRELIVMVVLAEFGLHYFPWRMLIGRKLPRLAAYTLGLLAIMVPLSVWLMDRNEIEIMQTLWIAILAAGGTVFALYGLDHYMDLEKSNAESIQREKVTTELLRDKDDE